VVLFEFELENSSSSDGMHSLLENYTVNLSLTKFLISLSATNPRPLFISQQTGSLPSCFTSLTEFTFSLIERCSMDHRPQNIWRSLGSIWVILAALYVEVTIRKDLRIEAELARR
jgi:hypothetical protein